MNILLVEDEFITTAALRRSLTRMGYIISGEATNADSALEILKENTTDLAILDINIEGDKNGIWIANYIRENYNIPYIFLTAYGDKSIVKDAMETKPFGYLMKPFEAVDIFTAIETTLVNFSFRKEGNKEAIKETIASKDCLFVKEDHLYTKIKFKEIKYIKSLGNYLEVHTTKQKHIIRSTMRYFEEVLPKTVFFRTHKTVIINLEELSNVGPNFIILDELELPLSQRIRPELLKKLSIN